MSRVCMMDLQFFVIRCVLLVHIMLVSPIRSQHKPGVQCCKKLQHRICCSDGLSMSGNMAQETADGFRAEAR